MPERPDCRSAKAILNGSHCRRRLRHLPDTANITAVKLVSVLGLILPAAVVVFPISYIAGDVLTEVYGFRQARRVDLLGFFCNCSPCSPSGWGCPARRPFWDAQGAYERILGYVPRLLVASFLAYLIGEFANSIVLAKMKVATNGAGCGAAPSARRWWARDWTRSCSSSWRSLGLFRSRV
jgi:uncharacterized integral membrane protein (TIGR00697 family)